MHPANPPPTEKSQILHARAQALAREASPVHQTGGALEVVEFSLAHERYALETAYLGEVLPLEDLTPLPCTPAFMLGVVNARGRILPVIDLKKFFELPDRGITNLHRILVVRNAEMIFGILADTIVGVQQIAPDSLQPALPSLTGVRAEFLKGVTATHLVVLDGARILGDRRLLVHEDVETSAA